MTWPHSRPTSPVASPRYDDLFSPTTSLRPVHVDSCTPATHTHTHTHTRPPAVSSPETTAATSARINRDDIGRGCRGAYVYSLQSLPDDDDGKILHKSHPRTQRPTPGSFLPKRKACIISMYLETRKAENLESVSHGHGRPRCLGGRLATHPPTHGYDQLRVQQTSRNCIRNG
jgi:hypothetical protein